MVEQRNPAHDRVELFWLPVGAGGWFVRANSRCYEALVARREHRAARPLFHSALQVVSGGRPHVVEMAPVWSMRVPGRGVVAEGPVGTAYLGRWRAFRYEVRCWPDGTIPDLAEAVDSPVCLSDDAATAARVLALVPAVPVLTWGRDESGTGDMWNSNSLISWLLAGAGIGAGRLRPPRGGRAPGWDAGVRVSARPAASSAPPSTARPAG